MYQDNPGTYVRFGETRCRYHFVWEGVVAEKHSIRIAQFERINRMDCFPVHFHFNSGSQEVAVCSAQMLSKGIRELSCIAVLQIVALRKGHDSPAFGCFRVFLEQ